VDGGDVKVQSRYKQTELGELPAEWEVTSLGKLGSVIRGASPRPKGDKRFYGGRIPRLMVEDVTRDRKFVTPRLDFLTEEGAKRSRPCKLGTLTVVCSGTPNVVGTPSFLAVDACIHDGMMALVNILPRVVPDYLFHQLCSYQDKLYKSATHGGTFVNLTTTGFRAFQVVLPPTVAEQRAIATALSDVDALLSGLNRLIAKKRDLKQAAMQQLLTGQIRLPGFKEEWEVKRIGDFTDCTAGGTPSTRIAEYWGGKMRWMSSGELNLKRVYEVEGRITEAGIVNSSTKFIPEKCVLIGLAGQGKTRGTVAMNYVELCTNQSIAAIFPNASFVPEYLYYNLDARYDELREMSAGDGGRGGLNLKIINAIPIPFPPLPEQTAIAAVLSDMDAELTALEARREKTRLLKLGMMQELLTGKIRLIPPEPANA